MSSGGTWVIQNKRRPGAYINFKAIPEPMGAIGTRGVMTAAIPMSWGPEDEIIELLGTDLINGNSLPIIGCTAADAEESLLYRLCLSNSYKALLYRLNTGGVKASAVMDANVNAVAKWAGIVGNDISVATVSDLPADGYTTVQIFYKGILRETFVVETDGEMAELESVWVDFVCDEGQEDTAPIPNTGIELEGGTDGTVNESATLPDYFDKITTLQWNVMTVQSEEAAVPALIKTKIESLRNALGKKVQGVVYNDVSANFEGIVGVKQGFKTVTDDVSAAYFPLWVASLLAGKDINESATAAVVEGATEITGYIPDDEVDAALVEGWFILGYRQDGAVTIEQDINTLHTFTVDKPYAFSKNRVIRCLDEIGNQSALIFNRNYAGQINNDELGRSLYKSELISYLDKVQERGAITNFSGVENVTILPGENIDAVVVDLEIQPIDSMEKLYMTCNINA